MSDNLNQQKENCLCCNSCSESEELLQGMSIRSELLQNAICPVCGNHGLDAVSWYVAYCPICESWLNNDELL